jgi:hypothetical protein
MMPVWKAALACSVALVLAGPQRGGAPRAQPPPATTFAARVAALSETPGYFDTDNLISNERSYLHVLPDLDRAGLRGGAYLGVGPDQNFTYIARTRPAVAILVDIRRDNLLLHLLFKALFAHARTRVEYLAMLTGRAPPATLDAWRARSIEDLVTHIDGARPLGAAGLAALQARLDPTIRGFGVPLSPADFGTIHRFHGEFTSAGLLLQFRSAGRAPQFFYPTYRDLLLETDRRGRRGHFLASEDDFQFLKSMQARDLMIPVVGNLAGTTAMPAIAAFLQAQTTPLTVFYTSNVEFYLFREGRFPQFVVNVARLPRRPESVIVRSAFNGIAMQPGYGSASLTQQVSALVEGFAAGRFQRYADILR